MELRDRSARIYTAIYFKGHVRRVTWRLRWLFGRQGLAPATCATSGGVRAQGRSTPRGGQLAGQVTASSERHWRQELRWVFLIPEFCPGGPRQTCGPTLSTNQMRLWDLLGAPDCLHVPIRPANRHQHLFFPHFWQGNSRKSQELAWGAGSVQEKRIKRQQTVSFAGCKVLAPNPGFLLASMPSYCRFRPIEGSYSQSVSVSVHQDKIRGSSIPRLTPLVPAVRFNPIAVSGTAYFCARLSH